MSVTYAAVGAVSGGATTATLPVPAGSAGQGLLAILAWGNGTDAEPTTPTGWTKIGASVGGTSDAFGSDVGHRGISVFWRESDNTETNCAVTLGGSGSGRTSAGAVTRYTAGLGGWVDPVLVFANDATIDTNYSATAASDPGGLSGDHAVGGFGLIPSANTGSPSLTWTGGGTGTFTSRAAGQITTGYRVRMVVASRDVSGTTTANPILAYSAIDAGPSVLVRLRDVAAGGNTGTLDSTLDDSVLAASGAETFTGVLASTLDDAALAATGAESITGTLTTTLDDSVLAGQPKMGFAGVATWSSTSQQITDEMTLAAWAGADFVRVDLYWNLVEGTQGTFDWSAADARFDAADAAGLKVLWVVSGSPAWARTNGEASTVFLPTSATTLATFLTAAVTRYATRGTLGGHHWEIWNEPNTDWHLGDGTQVTHYVACLSAAYPAIKAADSTAQVLIGGILRGGRNDDLYGCVTDDYWLTQFYAAGGGPYFDIFSYHPYCQDFDPANTTAPDHTNGASIEHGWQGVALMNAVLSANGDQDKPFWVTEWGQHIGTATNAVSAATQATYLENAFARAQTAAVDHLFVFDLRDAGTDAANQEHNFGMVTADFTPKASLRSFRNKAVLAVGNAAPTVTTGTAPTHVVTVDTGYAWSITPTTPAVTGSQSGDVLVAFCQSDPGPAATPDGTGWTQIGTVTSAGNGRVLVFTKTATAAQGAVVWTFSGYGWHRVTVACYRGGVEPTSLAQSNTATQYNAVLSNTVVGNAGALYVACGFCTNNAASPAWDATMTARFTDNIAGGGNQVADIGFTDSDAWTGEKTFTPGNGATYALILAASVLITSPSGAETVTGTLAATLDDSVLAAVGAETISGTLATTLGDAVLVAAGTETISGSMATTLDDSVLAGVGSETVTGTFAATLDDSVLAVAGVVANPVTGTLATTLDDSVLAASATETFAGTLASTLGDATLAGVGAEILTGTLATTLDDATLSASGWTTATGTLASTLDDAVLAAAGVETISGTLSTTLADSVLAATGTAISGVTGALAATLGDSVLAASGSETITGVLASTLADAVLAGSGYTRVTGALASTLDDSVLAATASETITGTLASTLGDAILAATGTVVLGVTGALATTLDGATLAASGAETITGVLAVTLDDATLAGVGAEILSGTLTVTLGDAVLTADGTVANPVTGTLVTVLDDAELLSVGTETFTGTLTVTLDDAVLLAAVVMAGAFPLVADPRLTLTLPTSTLTVDAPTSQLALTLPDARLELT